MSSSTCSNSTVKSHQNWLFVTVYSMVFLVGLTLNVTALVIFFRNTKSRSHTTMYMVNLAFADVLLVCTLPVRIYYHAGLGCLHQRVCDFAGVILLSNMYGSIFLLTCISFDRCVAVCFPLSSLVREGRKKAWCVCLGIWILTLGASLPIYLKPSNHNNSSIVHTMNMTMNTTRQCFGAFPTYATQAGVLASTIVFGFGIPLTVMIISSWGLIQALNKSTAAQTSELVDSGRIKRMIITNLAIFLLCFLPYHVILVLLHMFNNSSMSDSMLTVYRYSLMVACLNAMLDPLAYYFATETFRKKMVAEAVRKKCQINTHSSDGNNRSRTPLTT